MKTFATRLKAARMAAGFRSAQRFADTAGFDPHAYRKYERGSVEPNFETLLRICELLNVSVSHLLPVPGKENEKTGSTQKGGASAPAAA